MTVPETVVLPITPYPTVGQACLTDVHHIHELGVPGSLRQRVRTLHPPGGVCKTDGSGLQPGPQPADRPHPPARVLLVPERLLRPAVGGGVGAHPHRDEPRRPGPLDVVTQTVPHHEGASRVRAQAGAAGQEGGRVRLRGPGRVRADQHLDPLQAEGVGLAALVGLHVVRDDPHATACSPHLGEDVAYDWAPYFFTDQYDLGMEYVGLADPDAKLPDPDMGDGTYPFDATETTAG